MTIKKQLNLATVTGTPEYFIARQKRIALTVQLMRDAQEVFDREEYDSLYYSLNKICSAEEILDLLKESK